MTEEERSREEEMKTPAGGAAERQSEAETAAAQEPLPQPEEAEAPAPERQKKKKNGPGTAATFWLLVLYDLPGVGLIASALAGFLFAKTRAHRSLARACFVRGVIVLLIAGALTACYFFLRNRYALSNFLERILQELLNFVRSNGDKL